MRPNETPTPLSAKEKQALKEQWQKELDKYLDELNIFIHEAQKLQENIQKTIDGMDSELRDIQHESTQKKFQELNIHLGGILGKMETIKKNIDNHLKKEPK